MKKEEYFSNRIKASESTRERLFLTAVYLFSNKGYDNVGIRELCRFIGIKASSFYNHYRSKEMLFLSILDSFEEHMNRVVFTEDEIDSMAESGDIGLFLRKNMEKFAQVTGNPLFFTMLQIVFMESYKNKRAYEIAIQNVYYIRKDYTEAVLKKMIDNGSIQATDVELITAEYYYALKGMLDEYLLQEVWAKDIGYLMERIKRHVGFFIKLLAKE